jgi:hypothetical protein
MQERPGHTLELRGICKDFLNTAQMAQQLRKMIGKWNYMKLKSGHQIEEATQRMGENLCLLSTTCMGMLHEPD